MIEPKNNNFHFYNVSKPVEHLKHLEHLEHFKILKCSSVKHFKVLNRFKMKIIIFWLNHTLICPFKGVGSVRISSWNKNYRQRKKEHSSVLLSYSQGPA